MINLAKYKSSKFDKIVKAFTFHHPYVAFFLVFIGMPVFILASVFILATVIIFPISWIMGWM